MTTLRDKVKQQIESASTKETANVQSVLKEAEKKIAKMSSADARKLLLRAGDWFILNDEEDDDFAAALNSKNSAKIAKFIADLDPVLTDEGVVAFLMENKIIAQKESASVETAKKHASTNKMVKKIAAIIKSMGMEGKDWMVVSDRVFKEAFGTKLKKEKAAVEKAAKNNLGKYKKDIDSIAKQTNTLVDRYVKETDSDWSMANMDIQNAILEAQDKLK